MWQLVMGAVSGLVGPMINGWLDIKREEAAERARVGERSHELAVMDKESEIAVKRLTVEQEIASEQSAHKSFDTSQIVGNSNIINDDTHLTHKQRGYVLFVELLSKLVRPVSTIFYQVVMSIFVITLAYHLVDGGQELMTKHEMSTVFKECIYTFLGMAETTLLWWFGVRGKSKKRV